MVVAFSLSYPSSFYPSLSSSSLDQISMVSSHVDKKKKKWKGKKKKDKKEKK